MTTPEALDLKIYELTLRETGEKSYQAATNAEDACKQAGWLIGDCFVLIAEQRHGHPHKHESETLVKIPCGVCSFQFAECQKTADKECPVRPNAPELNEWLKQAAEAHLCLYTGQALDKADYQKQQKWLKIEDAIKELALKPFSPSNNSSLPTCNPPLSTP